MRNSLRQSDTRAAVLLCLTAVSLVFVPPAWSDRVRATVLDATLPGQLLARWGTVRCQSAWNRLASNSDEAREINGLRLEVEALRQRSRQLEIENAVVHEEMQQANETGAAPFVAESARPLIVAQLIEATVLGQELASRWETGYFLDRGDSQGVVETSLVLDSPALKVDQGQDNGLESGQPVYAGSCVVGRIVRVGRWMSTVRRLTDPEYRGLAQIVRRTSRGMQMGARGQLEGCGENQPCRLTRVASNEPVRLGDEVYTAGRDSMLPFPMYYGKVVKVELREGDPHWDIRVEPAVSNTELKRVQVLRQRLNPDRLAAN